MEHTLLASQTRVAARRHIVGVWVVIIIACGLVIWLIFEGFPNWFAPRAAGTITPAVAESARGGVRTSALTLFGGLTLAAGAYWTARTVQTARESNEIAARGQVTERFTRAVDQIANTHSVSVRLGGIYALEQIARDSPHDREAVKQMLGSLVKERALEASEPDQTVPRDVQAALTVLGRRAPAPLHTSGWLDFRGLQLREVHLGNARVDGMNFSGADLTLATMTGAKHVAEPNSGGLLEYSPINLRGTTLSRATLVGGDLHGCNLSGADLTAAVLSGTNLEGADLRGARLDHAYFVTVQVPSG